MYLGPNVSFEMLKMALHRKHAQLMILACNIEPEEKTLQSWLQDITQHLQPSEKYLIDTVPTVLLFELGTVTKRLDGEPGAGLSEQQLKKMLTES